MQISPVFGDIDGVVLYAASINVWWTVVSFI